MLEELIHWLGRYTDYLIRKNKLPKNKFLKRNEGYLKSLKSDENGKGTRSI